ncbi:Uncharacterised protein [Bordetella pertussis]|nr:Uncharacterised protein [Bordetella pertussis]
MYNVARTWEGPALDRRAQLFRLLPDWRCTGTTPR